MNVAPYYKALTAGIGDIITATTAIVSLLTLAPDRYSGVAVGTSIVLGVLGVMKTVYVYLVRNEPLVVGRAASASTNPNVPPAP